ncbi:hypothetical protein P7K49_009731 [Saguinus oedipus]|uniref:Scaffolding anchor of CK1 domain-containing protein n=1 Tax=Saguinus oedipus TaxID=9490 RepID=A0ABQ9VKT9_SAGOE|nr:hypothetical protein P7K49_009731 [Saguinus oedipus]
MALLSEGLDELPTACLSPCGPPNPAELFSEERRLALEELVAGGPEALAAFLRRERLARFLNPDEVHAILRAAERPGEEGAAAAAEDSFGSSHDCSSGTYFPEQSDLEPPLLELGWPAFYRGAYRGATRVEAHFQPRGAGAGGPYGCKDALRQQLRSAREVSGPPGPWVARETPFKNGKLRPAGSAGRDHYLLCALPEARPGGPRVSDSPHSACLPRHSSWQGIVGKPRFPRMRIVPGFHLLTFISLKRGDQKYFQFQISVKIKLGKLPIFLSANARSTFRICLVDSLPKNLLWHGLGCSGGLVCLPASMKLQRGAGYQGGRRQPTVELEHLKPEKSKELVCIHPADSKEAAGFLSDFFMDRGKRDPREQGEEVKDQWMPCDDDVRLDTGATTPDVVGKVQEQWSAEQWASHQAHDQLDASSSRLLL